MSVNALFLFGINSKLKCDVLLSKSIISTSFVTAMHPISMIIPSQVQTITNTGVQALMTSQIAVTYVTEAYLFVSHATLAGDGVRAGIENSWARATSQRNAIRWHYFREVV